MTYLILTFQLVSFLVLTRLMYKKLILVAENWKFRTLLAAIVFIAGTFLISWITTFIAFQGGAYIISRYTQFQASAWDVSLALNAYFVSCLCLFIAAIMLVFLIRKLLKNKNQIPNTVP